MTDNLYYKTNVSNLLARVRGMGLRPIYVIFFEFLPISFQMKNNDDMRLGHKKG